MRTASSQHRTANWVISIVLAIFLASAAGFTVVRASFSSVRSLRSSRSVERDVCIHLRYNRSGAFTFDSPHHRFGRIVAQPELGTWTKCWLLEDCRSVSDVGHTSPPSRFSSTWIASGSPVNREELGS
jgi:hypothetical protein